MPEAFTPRGRVVLAAARQVLEREGLEGLTVRRLGEALGIRAPSLYKHFPDKAAIEAALIEQGLAEIAEALEAALAAEGEPVAALAVAYRGFALANPQLYRLITTRPLPRERLQPDIAARAPAPVLRVTGDLARARALWGLAHGLVLLELTGRLPPDADVEGAWKAGVEAFVRTS